jgi:SOS-response transcriptional repressor LexA
MGDKPRVDETPSTREQIYAFLIRYKQEHDGNSPSNRQIAEACHVSSSTVGHHLARLERANRIRLCEDEYRNIEIVGATWTPPEGRATPREVEAGSQADSDDTLEDEHLVWKEQRVWPKPRR